MIITLLLSFLDQSFGSTGMGFGGGSAFLTPSECRLNEFVYTEETGFGMIAEPPATLGLSPYSCYVYDFKNSGYRPIPRFKVFSADNCINKAYCVPNRNVAAEGNVNVYVACTPFDMGGQRIVGIKEESYFPPTDYAEVIIRSFEASSEKTYSERKRRSKYVVQQIPKDFLVNQALRDKKPKDLSAAPNEIWRYLTKRGIYITGTCDPRSTEPIPLTGNYPGMPTGPFMDGGFGVPGMTPGPGYGPGPFGNTPPANGSGFGVPGQGMMPPSTPPPQAPGGRR
jgi:hypothetical protein